MKERAKQGGADDLVVVLSDTRFNRALVRDFRDALGEEFQTPAASILAALANVSRLPGSGVVLQ
jgi:hypothetical protein